VGRLYCIASGSQRRLHVLVHQPVPEGEWYVQLEFAYRLIRVRRLRGGRWCSGSISFGIDVELQHGPHRTYQSPLTVTLTNTGNATLNISGISANLDYHISTNTCGRTLAAGANCSVSVTFTPTAKNTRQGTLTFNDNAPNSPQTVALSGTGESISLSATALNFGTVGIGVTAASKSVTVSNVGPSAVTFTGFALAGVARGDYLITANSCGATIAPAASCSVSIAFKPTLRGTRNAKLNIQNNGGGSPAAVTLTGVGN